MEPGPVNARLPEEALTALGSEAPDPDDDGAEPDCPDSLLLDPEALIVPDPPFDPGWLFPAAEVCPAGSELETVGSGLDVGAVGTGGVVTTVGSFVATTGHMGDPFGGRAPKPPGWLSLG
jgi:hypothetical protein